MINIDIATLNDKRILRYLCQKADLCAFHVPVFLCENKSEEDKYRKRISELLEGIQPYILSQYTSSRYIGLDYGNETEIYNFKSNDFFTDFLENSRGIEEWRYPNYPEDLCFLDMNGKCWFETVTHENECNLYDETLEDIEMLRECKVKFHVLDDELAWPASYLETKEELEKIRQKAMRKKQNLQEQGKKVIHYLKPLLEGTGFVQKENLFLKLVDDKFLLMLQVDAEFEDVMILYDAFPLYMDIDDVMEMPGFSVDLCDIDGNTDDDCLKRFYNDVLKSFLSLVDMEDLWYFLWNEYNKRYDENSKKDMCLNEDMMYCALVIGKYEQAQAYINEMIQMDFFDEDERPDMKVLKSMLENKEIEKIQNVLENNRQRMMEKISTQYGISKI